VSDLKPVLERTDHNYPEGWRDRAAGDAKALAACVRDLAEHLNRVTEHFIDLQPKPAVSVVTAARVALAKWGLSDEEGAR